MEDKGFVFTVFTPAWNRAHTLPRVRASLAAQGFRDFEWLVVDDGSTDGTADLVRSWREGSGFPVRLVRQEHAGKPAAMNRGAREARGGLFLNLDSDDECLPEALERLHVHWTGIPEDARRGFSGVTGLCVDAAGRVVGGRFPRDVMDSDSLEMRYRFRVRGEKWGFQRTDVLRAHPFPEGAGLGFVPEGVVWAEIARTYRTRYVNEALRVYHQGPDQLTRTPDPARHARGMAYWHGRVLSLETAWFRSDPAAFLRSAAHYSRFSLHAGASLREQAGGLGSAAGRILWALMLPLGAALFVRDRARTGRDRGGATEAREGSR